MTDQTTQIPDWMSTVLAHDEEGNVKDAGEWLRLLQKNDSSAFADLLDERYKSRFIKPLMDIGAGCCPSGFTVLALSCLLIEAYVTFIKGWNKVRGKSGKAYQIYFNEYHKELHVNGDHFFEKVRCGILHQGEIQGGWREEFVSTKDNDCDLVNNGIVNAYNVRKLIVSDWNDFIADLRNPPDESRFWKKAKDRIIQIIRNCAPDDQDLLQTDAEIRLLYPDYIGA